MDAGGRYAALVLSIVRSATELPLEQALQIERCCRRRRCDSRRFSPFQARSSPGRRSRSIRQRSSSSALRSALPTVNIASYCAVAKHTLARTTKIKAKAGCSPPSSRSSAPHPLLSRRRRGHATENLLPLDQLHHCRADYPVLREGNTSINRQLIACVRLALTQRE
jgi:hypothetical protein